MPIDSYKILPIDELAAALISADDQYANEGESFLSDLEYDLLRDYFFAISPGHAYHARVGSPVHGDKVDLPAPMGGMQEIKVGQLVDWIEKVRVGEEAVSVGNKLDGISAMIKYGPDGYLQAGYSRGDGLEAKDITHHLLKMPSVPKKVSGPMLVRGECIMPVARFDEAKDLIKRGNGDTYKNPRGIVSGVTNSKGKPDAIYPLIDFVAYRVINDSLDKCAQMSMLSAEGFMTVPIVYTKMNRLTEEKLTDFLAKQRAKSLYEIDGLVVNIVDSHKAAVMNGAMREGSLVELSMFKFKVNNKTALSTVSHVEWNDSKHGVATATIVYQPVQLGGVTASRASGKNAQYIIDNGIGPGAEIRLVLSGDVIPNVDAVLKSVEAQLPVGDYIWTTNLDGNQGVNLVLRSAADNIQVLSKQIVDFFSSLDTPYLKDGNIIKLIEADFDTTEKIVAASKDEMTTVIGANGAKAYDGLHAKLASIQLYELMGATVLFGSGMGARKFKKLQRHVGVEGILNLTSQDEELVRSAEGFDKSARLVIDKLPAFHAFMQSISAYVTLAEDNTQRVSADNLPMAGQKVVFTDFRDKRLEAEIILMGAEITGSVSKKTHLVVADNLGSTSGKANKARELGIELIDATTFIARVEALKAQQSESVGQNEEEEDEDDVGNGSRMSA